MIYSNSAKKPPLPLLKKDTKASKPNPILKRLRFRAGLAVITGLSLFATPAIMRTTISKYYRESSGNNEFSKLHFITDTPISKSNGTFYEPPVTSPQMAVSTSLKPFQIEPEYLKVSTAFIDSCIDTLYEEIEKNDAVNNHFKKIQAFCYKLIQNDYDNKVPIEKIQNKISLFILSTFIETLNVVAKKNKITLPDDLQIVFYSLGSTKDNTAYLTQNKKSDIDLLIATNRYDPSIKKLMMAYRNYVKKFPGLPYLDDINGPYRSAEDWLLGGMVPSDYKRLKKTDLDFSDLSDPFVLSLESPSDAQPHLWESNTPRLMGGTNPKFNEETKEKTKKFFMDKPQNQMVIPPIQEQLDLTDDDSKKDYLKTIGLVISRLYATTIANATQDLSTKLTEPPIIEQLKIIRSKYNIDKNVMEALTITLEALLCDKSKLKNDISYIKEYLPTIRQFLKNHLEAAKLKELE